MSDFESVSNHPVQQSAIPAHSQNSSTWREVLKRGLQQSSWSRKRANHSRTPASETPRTSSRTPVSARQLTIYLLVALGVVIAFAIIWYASQPSVVKHARRGGSSASPLPDFAPTAKPKPAPGKPFVPQSQSHLPPTVWTAAPQVQQVPSTAVVPQTPLQTPINAQAPPAVASASPAQPLISGTSTFTPLVYQARHDKHFGGSCSGQLTLNATGFAFHCADDPSGSVQVALNEIAAVDENGVQLLSGKKYHFSIAGMSKGAEQQVFANWLHRVR